MTHQEQSTTSTRTRNKRAEITDNVEAGTVTFKFSDGGPDFVASVADLPPTIQRQLMVSRLHNKLMDSYADPASDARHEAMGVYAELRAGTWSQRGEAGPKRPTLLIEALADIYKKDAAKVEAWLGNQSEENVAALKRKTTADGRPNPIYVKMEEIKARRASEKARALKKAAQGIDLAAIEIPE